MQTTNLSRKTKKLFRNPLAFFRDSKISLLAWIFVIIPTFCSVVYFTLWADDVYISESSFVIRSPQNQTSLTGFGSLLQNTGFSRSQDDAYTVQEYMRSRSALDLLQEKLPVKAFYSEQGDLFSRFNPLGFNDSEEAFFLYFKDRLTINFDAVSGIATLRVRAFTPENGQQINQALLNQGEALINRLNERARKDTLYYAEKAVADAQQQVSEAAIALADYRTQNKIFDLPAQSGTQLSLVSTLKGELIRVQTQLAQLRAIAPENPQVAALRTREKSLIAELEEQTQQLAGGAISAATQTADYQRLSLTDTLAQQQLAAALTSLQNAQLEADRQQLYLEIIDQPSLPDWALEPYRLYNILATLIIGLMLYGVFSLLISSVREHKN